MRALSRLNKPQILIEKEQKWTQDFVISGKARPDNSKYAHVEIRRQLNSMSFCKCFYCESKLKDLPKEIDHFIEVVVDKNLAYSWENLFLSCDNCNGKVTHNEIAVTEVLNPCKSSDDEIKEHLSFIDEKITARNDSQIGLKTIQKFRLDSELLDKRRMNQLKEFYKVLLAIKEKQIRDNGRTINTIEREIIYHFAQKDQPYSLMFEVLIEKSEGF